MHPNAPEKHSARLVIWHNLLYRSTSSTHTDHAEVMRKGHTHGTTVDDDLGIVQRSIEGGYGVLDPETYPSRGETYFPPLPPPPASGDMMVVLFPIQHCRTTHCQGVRRYVPDNEANATCTGDATAESPGGWRLGRVSTHIPQKKSTRPMIYHDLQYFQYTCRSC